MIEEEINKIALEILELQPKIKQIPSSQLTKGEKINIGYNFLKYNQLVYTFQRMFPFCEVSKLSDEANKLHKELTDDVSKAMEFITKDPSEEVKKYLDNA